MAAQPGHRRRHWLAVPRRWAPVAAGLILPVMFAVAVMAGPRPAAPTQRATDPHMITRPGTAHVITGQLITGHIPLAVSPAGPGLRPSSTHRHVSQVPGYS
jgi:hypothetical protein